MGNLIFLDTETTGNNLLSDRLFQVCFSVDGKLYSGYFKPPIPISVKSQSITHITNKMVDSCEPFATSSAKEELQALLEKNILVAHNAVFDICMLEKEGVKVSKFICTLRVARFLDSECLIPEYNLQYLRYFHELEVEGGSHDAKEDVLVLEKLFNKLYQEMLGQYESHEAVIDKMVEVSLQPTLLKMFNFGKHKGKRVEEVLTYDKGYLEWMLNQKLQTADGEDDWVFTLKHYLKVK